jgi:hypothetical protein
MLCLSVASRSVSNIDIFFKESSPPALSLARLKAALADADHDLEFVSGHKLDQESPIPANMISRLIPSACVKPGAPQTK